MHTQWKTAILPFAAADGSLLVRISRCCHGAVPSKHRARLQLQEYRGKTKRAERLLKVSMFNLIWRSGVLQTAYLVVYNPIFNFNK
jgi:hypothetical protein